MFRKFVQSRSGNFAILAGVAVVPLCLAAGLAIDYSRHLSAQKHLQEMVDATSLSLAASREKDQSRLERLATDFLAGNQNVNRVQHVRLDQLKSTDDDVDIAASGTIPTTFMALAGYETLNVRASALAERAINGQVEVALILDNTGSMNTTHNNVARITTLKSAARTLVDQLLKEDEGLVRIGLVPYADYVNVGIANRGASWLSVGPDRTETKVEGAHGPREVKKEIAWKDVWVAQYDCSYSNDGVWTARTCGGHYRKEATAWETETQPANPGKEVTRHYRWYGCVYSRTGSTGGLGANRLHDQNLTTKYVGPVEQQSRCLTEIVPLTSSRLALRSAIDSMVTARPNDANPWTYIPTGLVWGLNVLSPGEPFSQGRDYDTRNEAPRKVAVLMTDGTNTMKFVDRKTYGTHEKITLGADNEGNAEVKTVNEESTTICSNMKRNGIEIFTVAFMVTSPTTKAMLENCSTSPATHYFDAQDNESLLAAFEDIGNSLRVVRLAR